MTHGFSFYFCYPSTTLHRVPITLNSKPTPGGRRIGVSSVPRDWANNPVPTVST
jgi:hypothetical protein